MKDITQQDNTQELSKKEKQNLSSKAWYHRNKEAVKLKREANREATRLKLKTEYKNNKQKYSKRSKAFYEANKSYFKAYYQANKSKIKAYYQANKDRTQKHAKKYYESNKDKVNARNLAVVNNRYQNDELFRIKCLMRQHTKRAFKRIGKNKSPDTLTLIGCTWLEAKEHFERLFQPGMTWANHGEWHIDHIIPIASATTIEDAYKLNHISNLQPLWATDNLSKGARF